MLIDIPKQDQYLQPFYTPVEEVHSGKRTVRMVRRMMLITQIEEHEDSQITVIGRAVDESIAVPLSALPASSRPLVRALLDKHKS